MEPPLTRLREFLSHPSWVAGVALPGALWAALVEHASEPFLWTWFLAFSTFVIDWFLGSWRAHCEDRFSTTGALGAGNKFILYTCLALLAFLVGAAGEAMFGGVSSSAGFALMTTVNVYIVSIDGLSALRHVRVLSGGSLQLEVLERILGRLLEQIERTARPEAEPAEGG